MALHINESLRPMKKRIDVEMMNLMTNYRGAVKVDELKRALKLDEH